jgi:8-oxo-dGTP pyrophosphatase MutT (NUDIX family)
LDLTPLMDIVRAAARFDPSGQLPFHAAGEPVGWVAPRLAERLEAMTEVFLVGDFGVALHPDLATPEARTLALARAVETLAAEGWIPGVRHELYAIRRRFHAPTLFTIERAAARPFGLTTFAVHVNGLVHRPEGGTDMWIARRSPTKPIDPGLLDNLVGGGVAAGHTAAQTLVKECFEEAGILEPLARKARPAGWVGLRREVPEGVQSEVIFVHDLALPPEFTPWNTDGEVTEFQRVPLQTLPHTLAHEAASFTLDAALVILDCLVRHGVIGPDDRGYQCLVAGLRPKPLG